MWWSDILCLLASSVWTLQQCQGWSDCVVPVGSYKNSPLESDVESEPCLFASLSCVGRAGFGELSARPMHFLN